MNATNAFAWSYMSYTLDLKPCWSNNISTKTYTSSDILMCIDLFSYFLIYVFFWLPLMLKDYARHVVLGTNPELWTIKNTELSVVAKDSEQDRCIHVSIIRCRVSFLWIFATYFPSSSLLYQKPSFYHNNGETATLIKRHVFCGRIIISIITCNEILSSMAHYLPDMARISINMLSKL